MSYVVLITAPDLRPATHPLPWTSLDVVLRHNAVGSGVVQLPARRDILTAVAEPNHRIQVVQQPTPLAPGRVLISGPIERPGAYRWSAEPGEDAGPGMVNIGFADNLAYLGERITYPDPATDAADQDVDAYTVTSINAETVMRQLVNLNAGPGALPVRRVQELALGPAAGVGGLIDVTTRFDPLLDVLRYCATVGGDLTFRIRDTGAGSLLFEVAAPLVRNNARFGRSRGNLRALSTDPTAPVATVAIVGGAGEGAGRLLVERAATSPYRRMEMFVNQSGVDSAAGLELYGDEALADKAAKTGLTATAIDAGGVRYGLHYELGDLVPVELASGVTLVDRVTAVRVQATPNEGAVVTPTIGAGEPTTDTTLVALVRELMRRLGRQERN